MGALLGAAALLAALPVSPASAQTSQYDVRGVVADSAGAGLGGAMVVALTRADSVLKTFATTNGDGGFTLRRLPAGDYILQVTFAGHQTVRKDFSITNANIDAGTVNLAVMAVELDPLVVSVDHVPFINKGDTLSFNTLAFPTRPNASVEDLLRRMPGIQIETDGSIKAMGKDVTKVLVEGKEFFGTDPTIATRSLPADAVKRVDVYDKQSDMAEFTGVRDGEEERTIDLKLNEDAKQGYFGRLAGGLGADGGSYGSLASKGDEGIRYNDTFGLNRFTTSTQLAVVGNVNNVNQAGFSWGDYQSFIGGAKGLAAAGSRADGGVIGGGADDGFTETYGLGINASHDFAAGSFIRGSYFLSSLNNLQNRTSRQQQLLGSAVSSSSDQTNSETTDNLTHRFDLIGQHTFGEAHDIRLRADLTRRSSSLDSFGSQETRAEAGRILNTASTRYAVDGDDLGGAAQLTWRKRLDDSGRTLVAEVRANLSEPDLSGDLLSTTELHDAGPGTGNVVTYDEVVQEQISTGRTFGQSLRISLTQPLGGNRLLEFFGERSATDEDRTKSIFDVDAGTPVLNDLLSSEFERTYTYLRGGVNFTRNDPTALLVLGLRVQGSDLDGTVVDRNEKIANGYTHVLPSARVRVQLGKPGRFVDLRYTTSTREPTLTELQPFADNSNPVNVYLGNPDLEPEYTHGLAVEYRFFDQFSFVNLYTYFRASYTTNDIVLSRNVDEQGRQHVNPVNAGHGWSTNAGATWDTPVRRIGAKVNLNYSITFARASEFVNAVENLSRIRRQTLQARIENRSKDRFDVQAGGSATLNNVDYSLNSRLNQNYTNGALFVNGAWYYRDNWTLNTSLKYSIFDQDVFGPGENIAFLDASISRLLMDQRAEIELAGFDLLDQNQGVNFTSTSNSIQETRIESLGRRLMLRFTYRLGRFGAK